MIRSMTGWAQGRFHFTDSTGVTATIKSLNHRYLETTVYLPTEWSSLEMEIRRMVSANLSRGKVTLSISPFGASPKGESILNTSFLKTLARQWHDLFPSVPMSAEALLIPNAFLSPTLLPEDEETEGIYAAVQEALDDLTAMREEEASHLLAALTRSLDDVDAVLADVEREAEELQEDIYEEMKERIVALVGEGVDEERILTEAGILAQKSNVEEEIVRARRFVEAMRSLLLHADGPVGKELNFYSQELHRELNTMSQKFKRHTLKETIVQARVANENFREQIQNVE